jgi:Fe-S cluster biosynthesis and repair protein YggX
MAALPFPNELGRRLYERVSQEAWAQWIAHSRMVINEYRLNLSTPEGRKSLQDHCEQFFFGSGGTPPDYAPQAGSEPPGGSRPPG